MKKLFFALMLLSAFAIGCSEPADTDATTTPAAGAGDGVGTDDGADAEDGADDMDVEDDLDVEGDDADDEGAE